MHILKKKKINLVCKLDYSIRKVNNMDGFLIKVSYVQHFKGEKILLFNSVNHFALFAKKYLNLGKSGTNKNQVLLFPLWHIKYLYIQIEINMTLAIF